MDKEEKNYIIKKIIEIKKKIRKFEEEIEMLLIDIKFADEDRVD